MKRITDWIKRWWRWLAAGLAIVAGVIAYILGRKRPPSGVTADEADNAVSAAADAGAAAVAAMEAAGDEERRLADERAKKNGVAARPGGLAASARANATDSAARDRS